MTAALAAIEELGATIVRANMPTAGWIGGPGTEIAILNRNPESPTFRQAGAPPARLCLRAEARSRSLSARLGQRHRDAQPRRHHRLQRRPCRPCAAFRPGYFPCGRGDARRPQRTRIFVGTADGSAGLAYPRARRLYGPAPARCGAVPRRSRRLRSPPRPAIPASRCRPASSAASATGKPRTIPFGVTFTGRAWSEPILLRLAYAFEQATQLRRPPPGFPGAQLNISIEPSRAIRPVSTVSLGWCCATAARNSAITLRWVLVSICGVAMLSGP